MAITGRPPSENPRNRNAKAYDWTTVENTPFTGRSPDLPSRGRQRWHVETRAWWDAVRRMPHCRLWTETDWRFAVETARLVEEFWRGELNRAAELRLRSAKLGLTHEDRLKLRIRYVEPQDDSATSAADPAGVARLDDRRKRLSGAP
ncbi:hypothetical protein [Lentzea sp. NBRC 102530]|uniref:phage terminase small subunit n=1 Tax=Lentzea sp. NBRC 102530 TaxID=3032201 RepID=UPI0024A0D010|nr:hypothetical protein [Lentzea sp. NBRC 102530]GLY51308.1 hypothetical protein Lesp01_49640 [Lentzea sp. NBRC 102530]